MIIIHHGPPSASLKHLARLADCFGIKANWADAPGFDTISSAIAAQNGGGVVLDIGSLERVCSATQAKMLATQLAQNEIPVLLLISSSEPLAVGMLRSLTGGAIQSVVTKPSASRVEFPRSPNRLAGELCSQSFARARGEALSFCMNHNKDAEMVMALDGNPSFVSLKSGKANVFAWATPEVFDPRRPLSAELEFEEAVDQYVPPIVFLRFAFGDRCWQNPCLGAGIIIDDPLLKKRYGFIDFPHLLKSARSHRYHVTLAFIPWNHWRTSVKSVRLFLDYSDCFSVCTHGCDHINKEFRSGNYRELLRKNVLAHRRMQRHRQRTGMDSEPLMVCPQEHYSLEAVRAFADGRQFMGLLTTACIPRDISSPLICGADLLLPAQDAFFGFPIFKRHYYGNMNVFAMAAFLGKPAILVEHHEFFKEGPSRVEEFVAELARVRPNIKWTSLSETVMHTHLRRRVADSQYEVRFFTDAFALDHERDRPAEYHLLRRMPDRPTVRRVTVAGVEVPFSWENGMLTLRIQAPRRQAFQVRVEVDPMEAGESASPGMKYHASVAFRRGLSELRDNLISRNTFALHAGKRLMKALRLTGAS